MAQETPTPMAQETPKPMAQETPTPVAQETTTPVGQETPTLYVCHGDDRGPRVHPCRRVQEAMRDAGIEYEKVIAAHGNPIPFLRKGSREELRAATGQTKLPALKLADGTVLTPSREILAWVKQQRG